MNKHLTQWLVHRAQYTSHRQLLLISGEQSSNIKYAQQCVDEFSSYIWVGAAHSTDNLNDDCTLRHSAGQQITLSQYRQVLGTSTDIVVYDAYQGLKPTAMLALEGCISFGGLFVLMTPPIDKWAEFEPLHSGISFSMFNHHRVSQYVTRLINVLSRTDNVAYLSHDNRQLPVALNNDSTATTIRDASFALTYRQKEISDEVIRKISFQNDKVSTTYPRNEVCVIAGHRGRGKSTLLGEIAYRLLTDTKTGINNVYVTAPTKHNCFQVFNFNHLLNNADVLSTNLHYVAPDQLSSLAISQNDLLIVDEAASIAPNIVIDAVNAFEFSVLTSTVLGYEGSGLGFTQKVMPVLRKSKVNISEYLLTEPLRWWQNDCLETLFANIFAPTADVNGLANVKPAQLISSNSNQPYPQPELNIQVNGILVKLNVNDLDGHKNAIAVGSLNSHTRLSATCISNQYLLSVYNLLTQAHYQTTPDDLMRMMDSQDHIIIVVHNTEEMPIAAAIVIQEQMDTTSEIRDDIVAGKRRLSGNLSLQSIASMLLEPDTLQQIMWRVSRIVVAHDYRHQSIGSHLIQNITRLAMKNDIDYVTTSFGLNNALYRFWKNNGFTLCKIGLRSDTSSGLHSGLMITPLSERAISGAFWLRVHFYLATKFYGKYTKLDDALRTSIIENTFTPTATQAMQMLGHYAKQIKLARCPINQALSILFFSAYFHQAEFKAATGTKDNKRITSEIEFLELKNESSKLSFASDKHQLDQLIALTNCVKQLQTQGNSAETKISLRQEITYLADKLWA